MTDQVVGKLEEPVDRTRHDVFIEMDVLEEGVWREQGRWIKYEENREAGAERWGKPHVSSLTFTSLACLRSLLESGNYGLTSKVLDPKNGLSKGRANTS